MFDSLSCSDEPCDRLSNFLLHSSPVQSSPGQSRAVSTDPPLHLFGKSKKQIAENATHAVPTTKFARTKSMKKKTEQRRAPTEKKIKTPKNSRDKASSSDY
jgi:hypothetical protein